MSTVLAAVDATEAARPVLQTASTLARVLEADTLAVHVGEDPGPARALAEELGASMIVLAGEPADEIVRSAERHDVALVVLALTGVPGRHEPGQTARVVATRLSKPVLVVPPDTMPRRTFTRVLFPLDGTRGVSAALRPLIAAYVAVGFEVIALHVFQPDTVPRFLDGADDANVWREEFLAEHCADLGIRLATRPGPTADSLLEVAASEDVDIIALGWRQDLSPRRAAVVRRVLTTAHRPVALIPLTDLSDRDRP
jgi:nucleotide-binding universal stress UspA family protein